MFYHLRCYLLTVKGDYACIIRSHDNIYIFGSIFVLRSHCAIEWGLSTNLLVELIPVRLALIQ